MGFLLALILLVVVPEVATAEPASLAFVQATVVTPDAPGMLTFVDASGRSRSHPVMGAAAARVARLRPGTEVIVVLAGSQPVVQDVKLSHASVAAPAVEAEPVAPPEAQWTVVPSHELRPTWPNPYSRFYRGPKPAPPPQRR